MRGPSGLRKFSSAQFSNILQYHRPNLLGLLTNWVVLLIIFVRYHGTADALTVLEAAAHASYLLSIGRL